MIEQEYLVVMDYGTRSLRIIELTEEEQYESQKYEVYEDFLKTIQDKYGFEVKSSEWMTTDSDDNLELFVFKNGQEVSKGYITRAIFKM